MVKELISLFRFIKITWYFSKFSYIITKASDHDAQIIITKAKWNISTQVEDEEVKTFIMDHIESIERIRFNIDNGQDNISQIK